MPFPNAVTPPSYYCELHAQDRESNVFLTGDTITMRICASGSFTTAQAFTGNYYVRNYYGTIVQNGTLSAATTVTLSAEPCGWYKVYLTQATNDATYGYSAGSGMFTVLPVDSRFPAMTGSPVTSLHPGQRSRALAASGVVAQGPARWYIGDLSNYAPDLSGGTGVIPSHANEINWYLNPTWADAARPRRAIVLFNSNAPANSANVSTVVSTLSSTYNVDQFWFEGPANEPGGNAATVAASMQTVYNAVKAGNSAAQVLGPCPVVINGTLSGPAGTGSSYLDNFCADIAAMSPVPIDGFSFHLYNSVSGDLSLGRRCLTQLDAILAYHGLSSIPKFQTEQSTTSTQNGVFMPRTSARWDMLQILLLEQHGIPKEHSHMWYDGSNGYWAVPDFWVMTDGGWSAPGGMFRAYSMEVFGKNFAEAYDFGTPGNDMMLGSRYHDAVTGNDVVVFQSAGQTDASLPMVISSGAIPVTTVDCFGNTSTVTPDSGGHLNLTVTMEPVYLRIPSGVTVTMSPWRDAATLAGSLGVTATVDTSGGAANKAANLHRVINGVQDTAYYNSVQSTRNNVNSPYFDDTAGFPAWISLTWPAAVSIDRLIVFTAPPWQAQGTLLDFDVQYWTGSAWSTISTITEPATVSTVDDTTAVNFPFVEYQNQTGCTYQSFFSDRWIFDVGFAVVSTTSIRLNIRNATYGMDSCLAAYNAQFGNKTSFGNVFTIREMQAYASDLAVPRVVLH